jgi:LCP family protein required for cell wall assembly
MNDELEQKLRAMFREIDADSPTDLPRPIQPATSSGAVPERRHSPHLAFRLAVVAAAAACLIAAVVVARTAGGHGTTRSTDAPVSIADSSVDTGAPSSTPADSTATSDPATPVGTFPAADPGAINILVVGVDNGGCATAGSATAGGLDGRDDLGQRTDTIMVVRVEPDAHRVAMLSFPRDLWVQIGGTNSRGRINTAFQLNSPQRLVDTIYLNFFIPIDHYVQVDFCGFKELVDAVGGVSIPFDTPVRDRNTGLEITAAGCATLDGDTALAYVRSRHFEYLDPTTGKYREDPSSDYGRIARQQDFVVRTLSKVLSAGLSLDIARGLIDIVTEHVVTDVGFTLDIMLELAGVAGEVDTAAIPSFRVEGRGANIAGAAVIEPTLDTDSMRAVLALFAGRTTIAAAVAQPGTTPAAEPSEPTEATAPTGSSSMWPGSIR